MGKLDDIVKNRSNSIGVLNEILSQLKKLNIQEDLYYREWYPLFFHLYCKGQNNIKGPVFNANNWGFAQIEKEDLILDYDYEFDSLKLKTKNRTYNPSLRLMVNGAVYPETQYICGNSTQTNFFGWGEYLSHNYDHMRCYQFSHVTDYQSNYGYGNYPFKMIVKKPWAFNMQFFATTTSYYFYTVEVMGWKLHPIDKNTLEDLVKEIEEMI